MPVRSRMSLIMGQIELEHPELFALVFGKIAESDFVYNLSFTIYHLCLHSIIFVYTLSSTNIAQSAPNLVKMYVTIRSQMSSIMDLIRPELFELSALESENLPYLTLFTL